MHVFALNGHLRFQTMIVRTKLSVSDVSVAVLLIAVLRRRTMHGLSTNIWTG